MPVDSKIAWRITKSRKSRVVLGKNVFIDSGTHFGCSVEIGDEVMIARNCAFVGGDHKIPEDLSVLINSTGREKVNPVVIEDNVWLGHGVTVLAGIKIGTGSIVGAGSVVTKNVKPFSIVGGCPAVLIKNRE